MNYTCCTALISVFLAAVLSGCGLFPERSIYSASGINPEAYKTGVVVVLPVSVNPQLRRADVPTDAIQKAVAKAVGEQFSPSSMSAAPDVAINPERWFPFTPNRLALAGKGLAVDGLVGVSVTAWAPESEGSSNDDGEARVDLLVTFVDQKDSDHYWTMSAVYSGRNNAELAEKVQQGLFLLLGDMIRTLGAGINWKPWYSRRALDEPLLTFFGPSFLHANGLTSYNGKAIDLQVTAIDNAGITSIVVENEAFGYSREIQAFATSTGELPVFLSSEVHVPLATGSNRIVMKARSVAKASSAGDLAPTIGHERIAIREVQIATTATHQRQVLAIASAQSALANDPATVAANQLVRAARDSAKAIVGEHLLAQVASPALVSGAKSATDGDLVAVYVVGVVHLDHDQLLLGNGPIPSESKESRLTIDHIINRGLLDQRILVLDLCAADEELKDVQSAVERQLALHPLALGRVVSCTQPVGTLEPLVSDALLGAKPNTRALEAFGALVARVASESIDNIVTGGQATSQTRSAEAVDQLGQNRRSSALGDAERPVDTLPSLRTAIAAPQAALEAEDDVGQEAAFVVVFSSESLRAAKTELEALRRHHVSAGILLGTSGFYGVAVAADSSVDGAFRKMRQLRRSNAIPEDSYVLPPSRVEEVIEPIALKSNRCALPCR